MQLSFGRKRRWGRLVVLGAIILTFEIVFFHSLNVLLLRQAEQDGSEKWDTGNPKSLVLPPPTLINSVNHHVNRNVRSDQLLLTEKVNPTVLRRQQLSSNSIPRDEEQCKIPPGMGTEGVMGFQALTKIQVNDPSTINFQPKKVLCIVVTDSSRHNGPLQAIVDTYAPKCDGFVAASNVSDPLLGAVNILTSPLYSQSNAMNNVSSEWDKVLRVWRYIYYNYIDEYDFFHLGPDDMYVIAENLRYFLSTYNDQAANSTHVVETYKQQGKQPPMYLGGAVVASRKFPHRAHCGHGAGYTLNRAALELFQNELSEQHCKDPTVLVGQSNGTIAESVSVGELMAYCLSLVNVSCARTVDKRSALRYLEFGVDYQARWSKQVKGPIKVNPLKIYHNIYMRSKIQGISPSTVSIHLVNGSLPLANVSTADAIRRIHALVYRHCQKEWDHPWDTYDVDGNPGYIHDATYVRRNPPPFQYHSPGDTYGVCEPEFGSGPEGKMGLLGLQKIRIMDDRSINDPELRTGGQRRKRVMCIVYTHSNRHDRVRSIAETYGPRCGESLKALSSI